MFTESPTYDRTLTLLRRHGATIVGIRLEADRPGSRRSNEALARRTPKLLYLIPDFQNPAGATCSRPKRARIVELARRHGTLIVEERHIGRCATAGTGDDAARAGAGVHAASELVHEAHWSGHPTGFLVGPARDRREARQGRRRHVHLSRLPRPGDHLRLVPPRAAPAADPAAQGLYAPRLDACLGSLDRHMPDAVATHPEGGFFVSLTLPAGVRQTRVRTEAAARGVNLADGLAFFPDGGGDAVPSSAVLRADAGADRRRDAAAGRHRRGGQIRVDDTVSLLALIDAQDTLNSDANIR